MQCQSSTWVGESIFWSSCFKYMLITNKSFIFLISTKNLKKNPKKSKQMIHKLSDFIQTLQKSPGFPKIVSWYFGSDS